VLEKWEKSKVIWFLWVITYFPILYLLSLFDAPRYVFALVAIIGPLIPTAWEIKAVFSGSNNTFFGKGKEAGKILETGRSATATVVSLEENSGGGVVTINGQPYLNLKLLVDDNLNPAYEVSFDTVIPRSAVPQFQPGAAFEVKIDQTNPQIVVLDLKQQ
jgi:hypothetical protein